MRIYKEIMLTIKRGKYVIKQKDEEQKLKDNLDMEKFQEELNFLYKNKDWKKARSRQKCLKFLHFLNALLITAFGILFILSFILITDNDKSFAETLYTGFSINLCALFAVLLLTTLVEIKGLRPYRLKAHKFFNQSVQDRFVSSNCTIYIVMDRFMSMRVRIINGMEAFDNKDLENMDYYDYINYNNPEDEDYYQKENPYDQDPFEKNMRDEWLKERENEEKKRLNEKRKKNLLKIGK